MPRQIGHNQWESEKRKLLESLQFESVVAGDDLELLERLLSQEIRGRTNPSDALKNALEITQRLINQQPR
jgi:hypothetical protein